MVARFIALLLSVSENGWLRSTALLVIAMGFFHADAQAQGCTTIDPPCPPPAPPSVSISPAGATLYTTDLTVDVSLFAEGALDQSTYQANWSGVTVLSSSGPGVQGSSGSAQYVVRLQAGVTATLTVSVCDHGYQGGAPQCSGEGESWNYSPSPPPVQYATPVVTAALHNGTLRDVSRCIMSCFDAVLSYSMPTYTSLDASRSVTLVYSRAQAQPRGLVQVDATDNSSNLPNTISLRLQRPDQSWVTFANNTTEMFFAGAVGTNRLAAQFDAAGLGTGEYDYSAVVRSRWADGTFREAAPFSIKVLIKRENTNRYGYGWWIVGLQRVIWQFNGIVLTDADGSITFFANCPTGCNTYVSPPGDFSTITQPGGPEGIYYHRQWPDGSTADFNWYGQLVRVTDRYGNRTSFTYTEFSLAGGVSTITDPAGLVTQFGYDTNGNLDWIGDPGGRISQVTVNANGDLTELYDPDGVRAMLITYDANHILQAHVDRLGGQWDYAYDFSGKLASVTFPTVTADGLAVRPVRNIRSFERELLVDPSNGLGTLSAPAPRRLLTPARITEPRGDSTRYLFNRFGDPTLVEYWTPQGLRQATTWEYNETGQPQLLTDPDGKRTRYTWSGADMTSFEDLSTGFQATLEYEAIFHQLKKVTSGGAVLEQRFYSPNGLLDSTKVGSSKTRYTWDTRGRPLTIVDPLGHQTTVGYFASGTQNRQSLSAPVGNGGIRTTSAQYDAFGREVSTTDAGGRTTTRNYDLLNRVLRTVGPANDTTRQGWNDASRTYTVTDALGQTYTTAVNALGWQETRTDPRNGIERWAYDKNGNIRSYTNRRGGIVTYTYDDLNRPVSRAADSKTTTWAYSSSGGSDIIVASNDESIDTLIHASPTGLLAQTSTVLAGVNYHLVYTHTAERKQRLTTLQRMTAPTWSRSFEFGYDQLNRFNWLKDVNGQATGLTFNSDQLPDTIKRPITTSGSAKLRENLTYTPGHLLSRQAFNWGTHEYALGRRYSYDDLDRTVSVTRGAPPGNPNAQEFQDEYRRILSYDLSGRLAQYQDYHDWQEDGGIVCPDPFDLTSCYQDVIPHSALIRQGNYTYDRVGNRTDHGAVLGNGNRLTSFDGYTLQYDSDGNLTAKNKAGVLNQTFTWNSLGQLVSVSTNGVITTFGYDAFDRRVRKTYNGTTTRYLWNEDDLIAELDGSGNAVREYAYFPGIDRPHSLRRSSDGALYYYVDERPGQVAGLISTGNQAVNRYEYDPWGGTLSATEGVAQPLRFGARQYDAEVGLYYNRARYYDPQVGRFISEDPLGLAGGINGYAFALNNPVDNRDPKGLVPCFDRYLVITYTDGSELWIFLYTWCIDSGDGGGGGSGNGAEEPNNPCPPVPIAPDGANVANNVIETQMRRGMMAPGQANIWWINQVKPVGAWDYKTQTSDHKLYDPFGNFNFGATGAALGYSLDQLLRGGGLVQQIDEGGLLSALWNELPFGGDLHGEARWDAEVIKAGYNYYQNACYGK